MTRRSRFLISVAAVFIINVALISWFQSTSQAATAYKRGSSGDMVRQIQQQLKNQGFYTGPVDGVYGEGTEAAVKKYQSRYGLTADGVAGEQTLKNLGLFKADTKNNAGNSGQSAQSNDLYLLSRIISAEGRGEPYNGQIAIGAVILNRMKHPSFPNTMSGVIYQPGAFSALDDGQFDQPIADISRRAAQDALNGVNPIGEAIYYYNPVTATNQWIRSRPIMKPIGKHVFCS